MSLELKGWTCRKCSVFNGEAKEVLAVCRACGEERPADLAKLEAVLVRTDLTPGQRGLLGDMQRAVELHGISLTPGQAAMIQNILERPIRPLVDGGVPEKKARWALISAICLLVFAVTCAIVGVVMLLHRLR